MPLVKQVIESLQGKTRSRGSLSDDSFDEAAFRGKLDDKTQGLTLAYYHLFKLQLQYLHGDHEGALAAAEALERVKSNILGAYYATRIDFYTCLSLLALPPAGTPELARRREEAIALHQAQIAGLAATCSMNFGHLLLVIKAELARHEGKPAEAIDLYDQAIARAVEAELPHEEALANELCGKLYLGIGKAKLARPYMTDAYLATCTGAPRPRRTTSRKTTATSCPRGAGPIAANPARRYPAPPPGPRRSCRG